MTGPVEPGRGGVVERLVAAAADVVGQPDPQGGGVGGRRRDRGRRRARGRGRGVAGALGALRAAGGRRAAPSGVAGAARDHECAGQHGHRQCETAPAPQAADRHRGRSSPTWPAGAGTTTGR